MKNIFKRKSKIADADANHENLSKSNKATGDIGEYRAQQFLKSQGYKILDVNYKTHLGEADIIAEHEGIIVFIEVKTRVDARFSSPAEAVTKSKQRTYILLAKQYIAAKRLANRDVRFDVIEVLGDEINHITDAFREN